MITALIVIVVLSVPLNVLLIWYLSKVLAKLLYTADNLGDLYIVFRVYEKFVSDLYAMDMFYGEPILKELMEKTKIVREEVERFEEIYTLTTDVESLNELNEEGLTDEYYSQQEAREDARQET